MRAILLALTMFVALAAPSKAAETLITILTGSPNGIYYPLGTTLSSLYAKAIPDARINVQATAGAEFAIA